MKSTIVYSTTLIDGLAVNQLLADWLYELANPQSFVLRGTYCMQT